MTDISKELARLEAAEKLRAGAKFFNFKNVGDSIEGAFVSRYKSTSPLGQDQIVYTLKTADDIVNVGIGVKLGFIHDECKDAAIGQAVKFSFIGEKAPTVKGYKPTKQIRVITSPDLIDTSINGWLEENGLKSGDPLPSVEDVVMSGDDVPPTEEPSTPLSSSIPSGVK